MPKRKCKYSDKYNETYQFIKKGRTESEAFCTHCNTYLNIGHGGIGDIKTHIMKEKHKSNVSSSSRSKTITNYFVKENSLEEEKVTAAELCFAYHVVKKHQSFASMDCLNKLIPKLFNDSKIATQYSSARIKTTCLINQVLGPHSIDLICKELESCSFYSISTDASNHKNEKMFSLLIHYYSKTGINIKLLKLENLRGETSDVVVNFCIQVLKDLKIDIKKCIGFGGDNANVNFGGQRRRGINNVYNKLKVEIGADIEGIGCPAHILHNTLQTAADQLSCDVDQIIQKLFNYFSIYTVRTERLKVFCKYGI